MDKLVFIFTARVDAKGFFNRPLLTADIAQGMYNHATLLFALCEFQNRGGKIPAHKMNINDLPDCVRITNAINGGFEFTLSL